MVLLVRAARAMYDELEKTAESERPLRAWPQGAVRGRVEPPPEAAGDA